jgi:hypothetical protein
MLYESLWHIRSSIANLPQRSWLGRGAAILCVVCNYIAASTATGKAIGKLAPFSATELCSNRGNRLQAHKRSLTKSRQDQNNQFRRREALRPRRS